MCTRNIYIIYISSIYILNTSFVYVIIHKSGPLSCAPVSSIRAKASGTCRAQSRRRPLPPLPPLPPVGSFALAWSWALRKRPRCRKDAFSQDEGGWGEGGGACFFGVGHLFIFGGGHPKRRTHTQKKKTKTDRLVSWFENFTRPRKDHTSRNQEIPTRTRTRAGG